MEIVRTEVASTLAVVVAVMVAVTGVMGARTEVILHWIVAMDPHQRGQGLVAMGVPPLTGHTHLGLIQEVGFGVDVRQFVMTIRSLKNKHTTFCVCNGRRS